MKVGGLSPRDIRGLWRLLQRSNQARAGFRFKIGNINGSYYTSQFSFLHIVPYFNQFAGQLEFPVDYWASGVKRDCHPFQRQPLSRVPSPTATITNSTGTFGLVGQPNFTTHGRGQGFGIAWSALLPDMPTLSSGTRRAADRERFTVPVRSPAQLRSCSISGRHMQSKAFI